MRTLKGRRTVRSKANGGRVRVGFLALLLIAVIAGPAAAYIHNSAYNSVTFRHGLYRGGDTTDGDIQVSTNVVTGGSGNLRIGLLHRNNNFYEYVCGPNRTACYHNHSGAYSECEYRPINGGRVGSAIMDRHSHPDTDYCG